MTLLAALQQLRDALTDVHAPAPVHCTYHPLQYAWGAARAYVQKYGATPKQALWVGMNPGPFGMAQTGVPFGDVPMVRDFLHIEAPVEQPAKVHPSRPVDGFSCGRREVSGSRLWGWAQQQFGSAEAFFAHYFVHNYCPLAFMERSGRNVTPDKLPAAFRTKLYAPCDEALVRAVEALRVPLVIGIGGFAAARCSKALAAAGNNVPVATLLHPSPASPAANRGWACQATQQLQALGLPVSSATPAKAARTATQSRKRRTGP